MTIKTPISPEGSRNVIIGDEAYLETNVNGTPKDLNIDCGANKTLALSEVVWDDQQVNISSVRLPAAAAPTWTAYKGGQVLAFSGAADEIIYFAVQLTHKYKEGEDIEFHIHYIPEDNTAGNVKWNFTYSWANISDTFPAETAISTLLATPEVTDKRILGEIANSISGTGKGISSVLLCSLQREGTHVNDTYDSKDIYLAAMDFHIPLNTIGSRQEAIK